MTILVLEHDCSTKSMLRPPQDNTNPLVSQLVGGRNREEAFREIYRIYARPVLGFFLNRGIASEECHDLRQETFLNLYRGIDSFRGQSSFETWLFSIAANVWRNTLRHRSAQRRSGQEVSLQDETTSRPPPQLAEEGQQENAIVAGESIRLLQQELDALPERMRQCFVLRIGQELKYREIASLMEISESTAKSHVHQARRRLRASLESRSLETGREERGLRTDTT